jgi:hypothetical protein
MRRSNFWPITGFYIDATVANPRLPTCREAGSSLIIRYCQATTASKPVQFHTRPPNPMSVTRTLTSNNHDSANLFCHSFQIADALPTPPAPSKIHPPANFVISQMCSCSTAIDTPGTRASLARRSRISTNRVQKHVHHIRLYTKRYCLQWELRLRGDYENPEWLMKTNALDRRRDLSVHRSPRPIQISNLPPPKIDWPPP